MSVLYKINQRGERIVFKHLIPAESLDQYPGHKIIAYYQNKSNAFDIVSEMAFVDACEQLGLSNWAENNTVSDSPDYNIIGFIPVPQLVIETYSL